MDANVDRVTQNLKMGPSRFLGRRGSRFVVIAQKDVIYWGSDGGLTSYSAGQSYLMEPTLIELERRLNPEVFCRISRTAIVNLDYVSEVNMLLGGRGSPPQEWRASGGKPPQIEDLIAKLEGIS